MPQLPDFDETKDRVSKSIELFSTQFRHRHTGLEDERQISTFITKRLNDLGVKSESVPVSVLGWKVKSPCSLEIEEETNIEFAPMVYSDSTPDDGIEGSLVYAGNETLANIFEANRINVHNSCYFFQHVN